MDGSHPTPQAKSDSLLKQLEAKWAMRDALSEAYRAMEQVERKWGTPAGFKALVDAQAKALEALE